MNHKKPQRIFKQKYELRIMNYELTMNLIVYSTKSMN